MRRWILHWASALLALFLLAASLVPALGLAPRFPTNWVNLHLSAGIALAVLTVIRLAVPRPSFSGRALVLQAGLLLAVLALAITGLAIYQSAPLGRANYLFGLVTMPTLIRLDHALHGKIILAHIAVALVLLALLLGHLGEALRRDGRSGRRRLHNMVWPWRSRAGQ